MRSLSTTSLAILIVCVAAVPAAAQSAGHYPVEQLGILDSSKLDVDINLEGSSLQIAAGAMQDQDPRLLELVSGLTRVRVQVGSVEHLDPTTVLERLADARRQLETEGWVRIIQVEEDSERVYVFSRDSAAGRIAGLTALVSGGGQEAVVVNIAGDIDPVLLGSVMARMGDMDLSAIMSAGGGNDETTP